MKQRTFWLLCLMGLVVVFVYRPVAARMEDTAVAQPAPDPHLRQLAQERGQVAVIVGLDVAGYSVEHMAAGEEEAETQAAAIARVRNNLLQEMAAYPLENVKAYDYLPYVAMTVDEAALNALYTQPLVASVEEDFVVQPALSGSIPLIRANFAHIIAYTGAGQTVAVLDTGVDKFHPDLAGKVVSEACYSTNNAGTGFSSLCPGGATSSTAVNSGLNCNISIAGCHHGTHVSGIVAGVAPGANLIAIQVFSRVTQGCAGTSPCTLSSTSDILSGLNRVYALRNTFNIASVNMSLGSGQYNGNCDNVGTSVKTAIDLLRGVNITTVIAAGNSDYRNSMGWPACISTAVSVASTTKTDQVSSFSNISTVTTLAAPGSDIYAPFPTAYTIPYATRSGTSMAAPHVAGAVAVLKEAKSDLTVPQITSHLTNSGPLITDQRTGGFVTKRRLDVWTALCLVITCDADDFRTLPANQTLTGSINPFTDVDTYYYFGQAGSVLSLQMNRTSGTLDPYLDLINPNGLRITFNNNGGGGVNALINGYILQQTGQYRIRARSVNGGTGNYQLIASSTAVPLNPVPSISYLSPPSATGTVLGSDFWVAINGQNFMPESEVRWNGSLRTKYYSSSSRIYIRVRGSDLGLPWPRTAYISVQNPAPGGGTSASKAFNITFPFLGESEWLTPMSGSSVAPGIATSFVISWTHPISSWRTMQNMDMRLRDENDNVAAWVRVVEQPGPDSFYRLLNAAGEVVGEGDWGTAVDLVITDTVTLHLDQTSFSGSDQTAIMTPTLTFGPAAAGTYNVEFMVDNEDGEIQADDVLGTIVVQPASCNVALESVSLSGPVTGLVNTPYVFTAAALPGNATAPVSYDWAPEPASGQGTAVAAYNWPVAGEYIVFVGVENCATFTADLRTIAVSTGNNPDLGITKTAPATALPGEPITYTLTISNSGALTATNLLVVDTLPVGATYVGGGTLVGNEVRWTIPSLAGYGAEAAVSYVVTANADLSNGSYSVTADGGYNASGDTVVLTRIVDAQVDLTPVTTGTLAYGGNLVTIPGGSVFADTRVAYTDLAAPVYPTPVDGRFANRAFRLDAYQDNRPAANLQFGESIDIILAYSNADISGLNESLLRLLYWDGGQWSSEGVTCDHDLSANRLTCAVQTPPAATYALFEQINRVYLPMITTGTTATASLYAEITGIGLSGSQYAVTFQTVGFTPQLPGQHVHFFFNTVPPEQAGVPGAGPWYVYGGGSPFSGYGLSDRPAGATQMCVLVANQDHSVILGSGNCMNLPG